MRTARTSNHRSFNPLPHAEGDLFLNLVSQTGECFNPLPHAEGDAVITTILTPLPVSIHSLTQRETPFSAPTLGGFICFNPLPHAEGDVCVRLSAYYLIVFQSTPSRRGRPEGFPIRMMMEVFQSTPSRRGRLSPTTTSSHGVVFQSTPSRRGRPHKSGFPFFIFSVSIHSLTQRETLRNIGDNFSFEFQSTPSRRGRLYSSTSAVTV